MGQERHRSSDISSFFPTSVITGKLSVLPPIVRARSAVDGSTKSFVVEETAGGSLGQTPTHSRVSYGVR